MIERAKRRATSTRPKLDASSSATSAFRYKRGERHYPAPRYADSAASWQHSDRLVYSQPPDSMPCVYYVMRVAQAAHWSDPWNLQQSQHGCRVVLHAGWPEARPHWVGPASATCYEGRRRACKSNDSLRADHISAVGRGGRDGRRSRQGCVTPLLELERRWLRKAAALAGAALYPAARRAKFVTAG